MGFHAMTAQVRCAQGPMDPVKNVMLSGFCDPRFHLRRWNHRGNGFGSVGGEGVPFEIWVRFVGQKAGRLP